MKNKLKYLIGISLSRKIKTKWFVGAQVAFLILLIGIINIDIIISAVGGDFSGKTNIYIVDDTNLVQSSLSQVIDMNINLLSDKEENKYNYIVDKNLQTAKEKINEDGGIIIYIKDSKDNIIEADIISKKALSTYDFSILSTSINSVKMSLAVNELGLTDDELNKISSEVKITSLTLDEDSTYSTEDGTDMLMNSIFPIIILPLFMLSLYLVQMIGAEVNDEKSTKAMEVIISNVSPKVHFFAKVVAGNIFVIGQSLLLAIYVALGLLIRNIFGSGSTSLSSLMLSITEIISKSSLQDKLIYLIPLMIVLIILTFLAYSLVAGILSSMTTNTEDFQQVQVPIVMVSVIGYYLALTAGMFEGSIIVKILSYVPFISASLSPSLLVLGQIGVIDVLMSIIILLVTNYILIKYGLKIYKVGILNYSSSELWKKMLKALKE